MASNSFIAFIVAVGLATYVGRFFYKRTGGNTQKSVGAGLVTGILAFLIMLTILWLIPA